MAQPTSAADPVGMPSTGLYQRGRPAAAEAYRALDAGGTPGGRAFHHVDPDRREEHVRRLAEAGIDVPAATISACTVIDALQTHPAVMLGTLLQENPFFVPPDQFVAELQERRARRERAPMAG